MEFANVAEFRQNAARVFDRLQRAGEVVILKNGRPIGLLVAADTASLDSFRVAAQRARAQLAVRRIRTVAARRGSNKFPRDVINTLIQRARSQRTTHR